MQFILDNDLYKVARITGPQHNLLVIRLTDEVSDTKMTSLPMKPNEQAQLSSEEVLTHVSEGLQEINTELGTDYSIAEIQFLPSDTKPSSVYNFLTQELIKRIASGGDFLKV